MEPRRQWEIFKGSPELLLTQLVSDRDLDAQQLRRLRDLIDDRLGPASHRDPVATTQAGAQAALAPPALVFDLHAALILAWAFLPSALLGLLALAALRLARERATGGR